MIALMQDFGQLLEIYQRTVEKSDKRHSQNQGRIKVECAGEVLPTTKTIILGTYICKISFSILSRTTYDGLMYYDVDEKNQWN